MPRGRWRISGLSDGLVVAATIGLLVGSLLPWVRSGRTWRSSYELVRTADRLGLTDGRAQRQLVLAWFFVPLLCGVVLVLLALNRRTAARLVLALVLAMSVPLIAIVSASSLHIGPGPVVAVAAFAAGAMALISGALVRRP